MHSSAFLTRVEQVLVPTLKPGDIVVPDNLPAQKLHALRRSALAPGVELRFLLP